MDNKDELFGHPRGLAVLFFTEMWERFSYYGMRALFVLYLVADIMDNGFGWTQAEALSLYGTYTMMVYLMSIPGGILADKFIGQKKAVIIGGVLLVAGHGLMAIPGENMFYTAITLIILGVGALKANISTMVGQLYKKGDVRRDKGFTLFYMGINLGSALSSLIVGYIGQKYGWHYGFGLAGIGMLFGLVQFIYGGKHLKGIGEFVKEEKKATDDQTNHFGRIFKNPISMIVTLLLFGFGVYTVIETSILFGILAMVAAVFLGFGINIYKYELDTKERDRIIVLLISFLMVIAFWGAFEQAGGLMNLYTEFKTDKSVFGLFEMTAAQFQFFNPVFILLFGIPLATYWAARRIKGKEESAVFKMAIGNVIMGMGFVMMVGATREAADGGLASMWWIVGAYFLHTIGELCSSPVALSFVTKLAPLKYGSIMMGLYFAMTGMGNKLAGTIGEAAQGEPVKVVCIASESDLSPYVSDSTFIKKETFRLKTTVDVNDLRVELKSADGKDIASFFKISAESISRINEEMGTLNDISEFHATIKLEFDKKSNKLSGEFIIDEVQNKRAFKTFLFIFIFSVVFGLLLLLFLKKLKKLTHGAEYIVLEDTH